VGREDIVNLLQRIAWRQGGPALGPFVEARVNGYPGFVLTLADGPETVAFQPGEDGLIAAIYMVRNPEKLAHVGGQGRS
jgi:RNA polymerase sigma-70 factor (ECF subfamily)